VEFTASAGSPIYFAGLVAVHSASFAASELKFASSSRFSIVELAVGAANCAGFAAYFCSPGEFAGVLREPRPCP